MLGPHSLCDALEGIDVVFQTAVMKNTLSCEPHPLQALLTNALNAQCVINTALAAKVEHLVVLSTDRAASPINAMGISREVMVEHLVSGKTRIAAADGLTGSPSMSLPSSPSRLLESWGHCAVSPLSRARRRLQ